MLFMNELESKKIQCTYCGEIIEVLINCSVPNQRYIEDCQVCCRPINFNVSLDEDNELTIFVSAENE